MNGTAWTRGLCVAAGFVSLGVGLVGVVLPLLPTTPFLLIAAACFLRGSARWRAWLLGNRLVGRYLREYLESGYVSLRARVAALVVLWVTLGMSMILLSKWYVTPVLTGIGLGVSLHLAMLGRSRRRRSSVLNRVALGGADEPECEVLERRQGRSGELALRRNGADLEIILNGAFLISTANEVSSRAIIAAGLSAVSSEAPDVLIGGLGLGYALDEALACERVRQVTVAEFEPAVERWFAEHGGERVERAAAGERAGRSVIVSADVRDILAARPGGFDLVSLDTDNGPEWLVRDENAHLYSEEGVSLVWQALRAGGAAVYWSPDRYPEFQRRLERHFDRVSVIPAHDVVDGRRQEYTMYVGTRAGAAGSHHE